MAKISEILALVSTLALAGCMADPGPNSVVEFEGPKGTIALEIGPSFYGCKMLDATYYNQSGGHGSLLVSFTVIERATKRTAGTFSLMFPPTVSGGSARYTQPSGTTEFSKACSSYDFRTTLYPL